MVEKLIGQGLQAHRAGRLAEAKTFYQQALAEAPRHPDALHLAGVVALQSGQPELAVEHIKQAVEQLPDHPGFQGNLAQAYLAMNRVKEAHAAFRRAAALDPQAPQFEVGAATCLALQGRLEEAEQQLRAVLQRHPGFVLAWFNLARAVSAQGRLEEAAALYRRAVDIDPAYADAYTGLGSTLRGLERHQEAEQVYRRLLGVQPDSLTGNCNLAFALIERGAFAEAAELCRGALALVPGSADLHLIIGTALAHQGRLTEARGAFHAAVEADPANLRARWGYGYALIETGRPRAGLQWLEEVLEHQPDAAEFRDSLSLIRLSLGDMQGGWEQYSWRAARLKFLSDNRGLRLADKLPDNVSGRSVCLLREQGIGDELFFLRFASLLKSLGADITHQAHPKLAALLGRVTALDRIYTGNQPPPAADAVLLVGDLPLALGRFAASPLPPQPGRPKGGSTIAESFALGLRLFFPKLPPPLALPVLPGQLEQMEKRLRALGPPPYLGVTWRAGTPPAEQRGSTWMLHKEIGLQALGAALRGANGTWLSLQRNPRPSEVETLASHAGVRIHDFAALNEDLEAMLALLALLDDYVGVSNTNMHLRAGVGRTARVLVPCPAEWRWLSGGNQSPWFPGFRLYRQRPDGDWSGAMQRLGSELRAASDTP